MGNTHVGAEVPARIDGDAGIAPRPIQSRKCWRSPPRQPYCRD